MKERAFLIVLYTTVGLCAVLTLVHLIYAIYAYQHCSIIYFVSKELWW